MPGIKDKVAIIGMGCTSFGERWEDSANDLVVEACYEAMEDAGIDRKDIQAAWVGTQFGGTGTALAEPMRMSYIPVTRVVNACATGSEALRGAAYAVAAGVCDMVLAVGIEKLKDQGISGVGATGQPGHGLLTTGSMPANFSLLANRYFDRYGISWEDGKHMMARISWKSHKNGALNKKAHFQKEISMEAILSAPMIAPPLGLFDCCGVSDGAAAAIVTTPEKAKSIRKDPVHIKAMQIVSPPCDGKYNTKYDYTYIESNVRAGAAAYKEADIKNPREEISLAEVHDCFSISEAIIMEDLQISPKGKVIEDIESGFFDLDGKLPVQPDGGLKCFGHPVGASGLRMVYEVYLQLQGRAEARQIKDPKLGLTHNMGGLGPDALTSFVGIFGLPEI